MKTGRPLDHELPHLDDGCDLEDEQTQLYSTGDLARTLSAGCDLADEPTMSGAHLPHTPAPLDVIARSVRKRTPAIELRTAAPSPVESPEGRVLLVVIAASAATAAAALWMAILL